jgi:hypothetical protein
MRAVHRRFETVVRKGHGLHQPLDNLARVRTDGSPVPQKDVSVPYRLIFRPTSGAKRRSDPTIDFRDDLAQNIPAGSRIYEVLALEESQEMELRERGVTTLEDLVAHAAMIGTIATESEFIASKYGDYRLFLRHNDRFIRDEFKRKTEFEKPL